MLNKKEIKDWVEKNLKNYKFSEDKFGFFVEVNRVIYISNHMGGQWRVLEKRGNSKNYCYTNLNDLEQLEKITTKFWPQFLKPEKTTTESVSLDGKEYVLKSVSNEWKRKYDELKNKVDSFIKTIN